MSQNSPNPQTLNRNPAHSIFIHARYTPLLLLLLRWRRLMLMLLLGMVVMLKLRWQHARSVAAAGSGGGGIGCVDMTERLSFDIRLRKVRASGGFISFSYFFHAHTPAPPSGRVP